LYALFELVSIPFAWSAGALLTHSVELAGLGVGGDVASAQAADKAFSTMAGLFHMLRAVADIGLVLAFVAGLVWLHRAWTLASKGRKPPTVGAGAVVLWSLVPLYGYWRLLGFLQELARRNGVAEKTAGIQRWWFVTAAHVALRLLVVAVPRYGAPEVADSIVAAASALLGMRMLAVLQRGQSERATAR
jgi:hypothetical protein